MTKYLCVLCAACPYITQPLRINTYGRMDVSTYVCSMCVHACMYVYMYMDACMYTVCMFMCVMSVRDIYYVRVCTCTCIDREY